MISSIERRSSPRNQLSGLVHVRPANGPLAQVEVLDGLAASSSRSLSAPSPRPSVITLPASSTKSLSAPSFGSVTGPLANVSLNSIYFLMESVAIRKSMQLLVSFPNEFRAESVRREFMVEVVRQDTLFQGRFGVAARILENIQLRLRDGLIVPETGFWSGWPLVAPTRLNVYA